MITNYIDAKVVSNFKPKSTLKTAKLLLTSQYIEKNILSRFMLYVIYDCANSTGQRSKNARKGITFKDKFMFQKILTESKYS